MAIVVIYLCSESDVRTKIWIIVHFMADTSTTTLTSTTDKRSTSTVIQSTCRILLGLLIMLVLVLYPVTQVTNDLAAIAMRIRVKIEKMSTKANQSRRSHAQFVGMCSANFNGRRLGNQLFNWAAILYVANLTGRLYSVW